MDGSVRSNEAVMVGSLVAVSPEQALAMAQHKRRTNARCLATVYRDVPGCDEQEEVELAIDGEFAEGGFCIHGARRIDTGARVELSTEESETISEDEEQSFCDRAEQYREDAYDRAGDR